MVIFFFEFQHIRVQKILASMIFFERPDQALLLTSVECLGDNPDISAHFFAVYESDRRIRNFVLDQSFHLFGRFYDKINDTMECIMEAWFPAFSGLFRQGKASPTM